MHNNIFQKIAIIFFVIFAISPKCLGEDDLQLHSNRIKEIQTRRLSQLQDCEFQIKSQILYKKNSLTDAFLFLESRNSPGKQSAPSAMIPPTDVTVEIKELLRVFEGKYFIRQEIPMWNTKKNQFGIHQHITTWDGENEKNWISDSPIVNYPNGTLKITKRPEQMTTGSSFPIVFGLYGGSEAAKIFGNFQLANSIAKDKVRLERTSARIIFSVDLSVDHNYLPSLYSEKSTDGHTICKFSIVEFKALSGEMLPSKWLIERDYDDKEIPQFVQTVELVDFRHGVKKSDVEFVFPPGTLIDNDTNKSYHIVENDYSLRDLTLEDIIKPYDQIAGQRGTKTKKYLVSAFVCLSILAFVFFLRKRRRD